MATQTPSASRGGSKTVGIPTARNVEHVAYNVPDLDEAIKFFTEVLGAEFLFRTGPFEDPAGNWMEVQLGVHPKAKVNVAMLRLGPTFNVELLAYEGPGRRSEWPGNGDMGASHLGIYVDNIDEAVAYLRKRPGVKIMGDVIRIGDESPIAGSAIIFVSTPIGIQLELVSRVSPLPFEATTSARLAGPARSWTD